MMVPPSSGRGMQKDQEPSVFWRVIVAGHGLRTRQVWPVVCLLAYSLKWDDMWNDRTGASARHTPDNECFRILESKTRTVDHRFHIRRERERFSHVQKCILLRGATLDDEFPQHISAIYRRVDHICPILHTPLHTMRQLSARQHLESIKVGVRIVHTLPIEILRRRSLEMFNTLNELNTRGRLIRGKSLEELVGPLRLIRFPECLWRGPRDWAIVRSCPRRGIVDRCIGWKVSGYQQDGLRAGQVLLDLECRCESDYSCSVFVVCWVSWFG